MELKLNVQNKGTINIADTINNTIINENNLLIKELTILKEHLGNSLDKEKIDEIIALLANGQRAKAESIMHKISKEVFDLAKELSLNVLSQLIIKNM